MATVEELALICEQYGERVGRRAYVDHLPRAGRTLRDFYATAPLADDALPKYDPAGWNAMYRGARPSRVIGATRSFWFKAIVDAADYWGDWVIGFIHMSLVRGVSHEALDSIANDEGEFVDDGCRFCWWFPKWRGWQAWAQSLSDGEEFGLRLAFSSDEHRSRHPEPGSPEAEAFMAVRDARIGVRDTKQENTK